MNSSYLNHFEQYLDAGLQEMLRRVQVAENLLADDDRQQAWHLLSFALALPAVWETTQALLLALAPKMEQAGFRKSWLVYLAEARRVSRERNDRQMAAECALQMGTLCRMMSDFTEADEWLITSMAEFAAQKNFSGQRRALNELAWLEQLQHKYAEATQHANRALALSDQYDITTGMSLRVLGMIANNQRNWQEAQAYHEKALAIFESWQDQRKIAWSLQNLAISYHEQFRFEEANRLYQRAAEIIETLGDTYHAAMVQMNWGVAQIRAGSAAMALPHLHKAAERFYNLSDYLNIAKVETNLGLCQHATNNYPEAERAFQTAIEAYARLEDHLWRLNAVAGLGMTYVAARKYEAAINLMEPALLELEMVKSHPYFTVTLNYMQQYLSEARHGLSMMRGA